MTLTAVRNVLRPLAGYDPRSTLGKVTAREVLDNSNCASLPEIIFQAMNYKHVGKFLEENTGFGVWAGAVEYRGNKIYYVFPGGREIEIEIDLKRGFPIPYKDGIRWFLYNCEENAGFAGKTLEADYDNEEVRAEADAMRVEACKRGRILPNYRGDEEAVKNFRGFQTERKEEYEGKSPLSWFSYDVGVPFVVSADWGPNFFDDKGVSVGCLFASGSEQNATQLSAGHFANADSQEAYKTGTKERTKEILHDIATMPIHQVLEKYN